MRESRCNPCSSPCISVSEVRFCYVQMYVSVGPLPPTRRRSLPLVPDEPCGQGPPQWSPVLLAKIIEAKSHGPS